MELASYEQTVSAVLQRLSFDELELLSCTGAMIDGWDLFFSISRTGKIDCLPHKFDLLPISSYVEKQIDDQLFSKNPERFHALIRRLLSS